MFLLPVYLGGPGALSPECHLGKPIRDTCQGSGCRHARGWGGVCESPYWTVRALGVAAVGVAGCKARLHASSQVTPDVTTSVPQAGSE